MRGSMRHHTWVVLAIAACGNGSGGGSIPLAGLGSAAVDAFCDAYVRCGLISDLETCRMLNLIDLTVANTVAAVAAGKVIYHGDKARECFDQLSGTTCDRTMVFSNRNRPIACDQTFEGTVGDAGACAFNEECISKDCNLPSCAPNTCCMGTCVGGMAPARAALGQSCSTAITCNAGYCNATTSVCTAFLADGAPCTSAASCDSNVCLTTCQPLVPVNGACTPMTVCRDIGDTCNSVSMTCIPRGQLGATCASSNDCPLTALCDATQKCVAGPKLGDTCSGAGSCVDQSYCEASTMKCTAPKPDGATCAATGECASRHCDTTTTHTCVTPPICI
jgi:hypothetical protein